MPQSQVMTSEAPAALRRGQPGGTEVVAVAQPVGHERTTSAPRRPKRAGEQRRGALAVHVVVAVHQDGAAGPHGGGDGLDRLGHAGERGRDRTARSSGGRR